MSLSDQIIALMDFANHMELVLFDVCQLGTVEQLKWLDERYPDKIGWEHVLITYNIEILKWILTQCSSRQLRIDSNSHSHRNFCLLMVEFGNLELLKLTFNYYPILYEFDMVFEEAIRYKQLSIARWLYECTEFDITANGTHYYLSRAYYDSNANISENYHELMWWMLSLYTTIQFWQPEVQRICAKAFTTWDAMMRPRRAHFMQHIAPHLLRPQN